MIRLLLSLLVLVATHSSAASTVKDDYFLAIKGGISLGSYETGLNRSLLKYIQQKERAGDARFVAFSGASAGSINSVLSALDHCLVSKEIDSGGGKINDSLENNFMQWVWDIGIDDLVPGANEKTAAAPDKAANKRSAADASRENEQGSIFSREGFARKKELLELLLTRPAIKGCEIRLSMSITKVDPYRYSIREIGETINLQRFVVPLKVLEVDGRLRFRNFRVGASDQKQDAIKIPSAYLQLVEDEQGYVHFDEIWNLAMASSAFPLAFEPVALPFCFPHELGRESCGSGRANTAYFSDGGLFDNSPIGVSLELAAQHKDDDLKNLKLIYINPDSYRSKGGILKKQVKSQPRSGLWDYGIYIAESFLTAQEQEYRSALSQILNLEARSYYMTNRFHYLLADLHYHFGAFYAEEFRFHDYLVGVYDAAHVIAQLECDSRSAFVKNMNRLELDYQNCVRGEVLIWIEGIALPTGDSVKQSIRSSSLDFFRYLFNSEFDKSLPIKDAERNTYIALAKSFGTVNKTRNDELDYLRYLKNLDKFKDKLLLREQDDLYKILYKGKKYTSEKVSKIYQNIIQMQDLSANCVLCKHSVANEKIGDGLKLVQPIVDSYLNHLDSGAWPLSIYDVFSINYGFNVSQKNQLLSLDFRPKSLIYKKVSVDFGLGFHRFGSELGNDHYQSVSAGLAYHRDSVVLPTIGFGYQYETKGRKVYRDELNSLYIKASWLDELFSVKMLYRLDEIQQYSVSTRDDMAFVLTADVSKFCQMILPSWCR